MTKSEKIAMVEMLREKFENTDFFYVTDASTLSVEQVNDLRGKCFEKGVEMRVVKNTLAIKAMETAPEDKNYAAIFDALKGPTALMFTETANVPARIIKEFRRSHDKPVLKAAYIDTSVYSGDDQIDVLASLKSKEELLADVVALLQSPIKNVVGALQSGGNTLSGLLKTLEDRQ